jgi:hypothetical protein
MRLLGSGISTSIVLGGVLFSAAPALADCENTGGVLKVDNWFGATPSVFSGAIGNINSIFLGQSAFVASPGSDQPDQPGGGVWVRAIGGEANEVNCSVSWQSDCAWPTYDDPAHELQ